MDLLSGAESTCNSVMLLTTQEARELQDWETSEGGNKVSLTLSAPRKCKVATASILVDSTQWANRRPWRVNRMKLCSVLIWKCHSENHLVQLINVHLSSLLKWGRINKWEKKEQPFLLMNSCQRSGRKTVLSLEYNVHGTINRLPGWRSGPYLAVTSRQNG